MTNALLASFSIGFLGSFHCMGMCGGLVASLSSTRKGVWWMGLTAYQLGRITTYTFLGVLTGLVGAVFSELAWFTGIQDVLAILAGTIMLCFGLHIAGFISDPFSKGISRFYAITGLAKWIHSARNSELPTSWYIVGVINGLLPCGLVYAGLSLSLVSGGVAESMMLMFAFGLGTVPAMMVIPGLLCNASAKGRSWGIKLAATLVICLGIVTMFRGSGWLHENLHGEHMDHHVAQNIDHVEH